MEICNKYPDFSVSYKMVFKSLMSVFKKQITNDFVSALKILVCILNQKRIQNVTYTTYRIITNVLISQRIHFTSFYFGKKGG